MKTEDGKLTKRSCRFCVESGWVIDYKEAKALKPFLNERDKILPRRITSLCAYHQRQLMKAIKKARILGIIPFASSQRQMM